LGATQTETNTPASTLSGIPAPYANHIAFEDLLTDTQDFAMQEIVGFEIADQTALPAVVEQWANGRFSERYTR
jgi:hypothetical protein